MGYKDITKDEFSDAYMKHPPGAYLKWAYKYFSKSTEKKNMKPGKIILWAMIISFLIGFIGTVANLPTIVIAIGTYSLMGLLVMMAVIILSAAWGNNLRIRKIRKILGVSVAEYMYLVDRFYPEG